LRRIAFALFLFGGFGFVGMSLIPRMGHRLDYVELPAMFDTTTIALPDGGRLTATFPMGRLQVYGKDRFFQHGWFVNSKGGHFGIGLTSKDQIAVCSARSQQAEIYDLSGRSSGLVLPCNYSSKMGRILYPSLVSIESEKLQIVSEVNMPTPRLLTLLMVPLWHPIIAWLMALLGGFWLKSILRTRVADER
jgi:hypothetical protein